MKKTRKNKVLFRFAASLAVLFFVVGLSGCANLEKPTGEPFYGKNEPPKLQEFRWSNGATPKTFDPAMVSAPPETDLVRALYEGLTDLDAKTLAVKPALATKWEVSANGKLWTFYLRKNAKWTNGESVVADDFVDSWKRIAAMGEKSPNYNLFANIIGTEEIRNEKLKLPTANREELKTEVKTEKGEKNNVQPLPTNGKPASDSILREGKIKEVTAPNRTETVKNDSPSVTTETGKVLKKEDSTAPKKPAELSSEQPKQVPPASPEFGVKAIDKYILRVELKNADQNFSALVAHPAFRPIYGDGEEFASENLPAQVPTNGAFRFISIGNDGIVLQKSDVYWDAKNVALERVRFVPLPDSETALAAYRAGELDALTNVHFEPLAVKLIAPYQDFRETTHNALNYYEFNRLHSPLNDQRVRKALNIALDRERLTADDTDGANEPAETFLPAVNNTKVPKIEENVEKAQELLTQSGFPHGENFPKIKLLINRNDLQRRIARSVARMWEKNLGIQTEIIIKDWADYEKSRREGDFDLVRRGVVLTTINETANLRTLFEIPEKNESSAINSDSASPLPSVVPTPANQPPVSTPTPEIAKLVAANEPKIENTPEATDSSVKNETGKVDQSGNSISEVEPIVTEAEAMEQLPAIPLYFATSHALVKPYINGFEINVLDAPSLKDVRIETTWQPPKMPENWLAPAK